MKNKQATTIARAARPTKQAETADQATTARRIHSLTGDILAILDEWEAARKAS